MKISVIVHSESGKTKKAGEAVKKGIMSCGVDCQVMELSNMDLKYAKSSDAYIFGTPTYYANISNQMKEFIDKGLMGIDISSKLVGVFSTANFSGGGSEIANLSLINQLLVRGCMIYSGGCACGKPYTHNGAVLINEYDYDEQEPKLIAFGKRLATQLKKIS